MIDPDDLMFLRLSDADLPEMSLDAYRQWIRGIPLPTENQIEAFADYVAGARSWHKHLSLNPPGEIFHFYIDPHAGMDRLVSASGEVHMRDRFDEAEPFQHFWMTTAKYRERFGYLAFSCARGDALFSDGYLEGEPTLVDHNRLFPVLQVTADTTMTPPREVLEAGTCHLTALIHPLATADYVARQLAMNEQKRSDEPCPDSEDRTWSAIVNSWRDNQSHASNDPFFKSLIREEKERLRWDTVCAISKMFHLITHHHEGFEREEAYSTALALCQPNFKSSQLRKVISLIAPSFLDGLFQDRPSVRRLRYISSEEGEVFKHGEVYESVTFNGGTYQIKGGAEGEMRRIGSAYFERLS